MKIYKRDLSSGNIVLIDRNIITKNMIIATERQYEIQRSERYLKARINLN